MTDYEEVLYMMRCAHLSGRSLRDVERELVDRERLNYALIRHQRVQDDAVATLQQYEMEQETRRLEELSEQETRRVQSFEQLLKEQAELERLKAIPTPTPSTSKESRKSIGTQTLPLPHAVAAISQPQLHTQTVAQNTPKPENRQSRIHPDADRYVEIHQELKKLRKYVVVAEQQEHDRGNEDFWMFLGDLRSAIKEKVGQIKVVNGANRDQINGIKEIMKQALEAPGPRIDPSPYFVRPPPPVQGEPDGLPLIFLYTMNLFVKTVIARFIGEEVAIKPGSSDPISIVAVHIIARREHCWRGVSLIDMMIAKFRVACPVLFGFRGSEKTEQGRKQLGWKTNPDGTWVDDQTHEHRMAGLGAAYAAISLRDFSKVTSMTNPYHPSNYWAALAVIINTPPSEVSDTQCTVLKAMIDGYEMRFLNFYGTAAIAALKVAVVDFPARTPEPSSAVTALFCLTKKIQDQLGLRLG